MGVEIRSLTGLRGVAATLVMLDHYAALDFTAAFPANLLPHMYVAVDVFMVLSGFVLARSYEARFTGPDKQAAFGLFLRHRIARLYPLYLLATLVCFGLVRMGWLTFLTPDGSLPALAANLLAIQTWLWPGSSLDGPGWSISAEWAANLLFPLLLPALLHRSTARAAVAAGAAFAVLALSAVLWGQLFDVKTRFVVNMITGMPALGRCVSEFALGIFAWRLRSVLPAARVLARDGVQAGLLALMLLLLPAPRLDLLFVALSVLLILGLSFDRSAIARWLGSGVVRRLGVISYSIYLLHITLLPVRDGLAGALAPAGIPAPWAVAVLCTAGLCLALATLTHRFVEKPAQLWLNHGWRQRGHQVV